jgi:hypothetical protein
MRESLGWVYHSRLGVFVHTSCPLDDVKGEDISTHTLLWGPRPVHDELCPAVDEAYLLRMKDISAEMRCYLDGDVCQCSLIKKVREQYTRPTKWVVDAKPGGLR